jgi:3-oxoacyl-[acyl-carrier protein] reductase
MTVFTDFDDVEAGDAASIVKIIIDADKRKFSELPGDDKPPHVDAEYADHTAYITGQSLKVNGGDRCRE